MTSFQNFAFQNTIRQSDVHKTSVQYKETKLLVIALGMRKWVASHFAMSTNPNSAM